MKTIYLYPKNLNALNSYIKNLEVALSQHYEIINKNYLKSGLIDLFRYLFRTKAYYLNWIEELSLRKYGKIQVIAFMVLLICLKFLRIKIIWTLHNKYSHSKNKSIWIDFMYKIMLKYSDFILTHSQDGVEYVKEQNPIYEKKVKYLIHPVTHNFTSTSNDKYLWDFLIWGMIESYKGIIEFLKFLKEKEDIISFRVLIIGQCMDYHYKDELKKYISNHINYYDEFYGLEEIANLARQAKFILFTYKSESLLSSGSLMDSIGMKSVIIGPNVGAFKDLSSYKFIKTYNTFDDIIEINNNYKPRKESDLIAQEKFCIENNWNVFGEKIHKELSEYLL